MTRLRWRKALQVLRAWLGADMEVTAAPRKLGGRYLTEWLMKSGCAARRFRRGSPRSAPSGTGFSPVASAR